MLSLALKKVCRLLLFALFVFSGWLVVSTESAEAANIIQYSDTISDSGPNQLANHTLNFILNAAAGSGSTFEITPPSGFTLNSTTTFGVRNVELVVDGAVRSAVDTPTAGEDSVDITGGSPGFISYTLADDYSIPAGSELTFRIGNHTSGALGAVSSFSTTTGTTTTQADVPPIQNSSALGRHDLLLEVYDGSLIASTEFVLFLNNKVNLQGIDTTEEIPPFLFNGSPTSTVGGTTLSVEISLESDEFAFCRYSTTSGTAFTSMDPDSFSNTGLIFHSTVVSIVTGQLNVFFVRCIDDEGNFNTEDFLISFVVSGQPTGTANTEGETSGDGTGSGDSGGGSGSGSGGTSGDSDGEQPEEGNSSGTGGSGGGGGRTSGGGAGGGFENTDASYRSGDGRVVISGYAFPDSDVTILIDGQLHDTVIADADGSYSITLDEIARGAYTFGVYAVGDNDVKSSTFSTSFTVTGARTSSLSNINVVPSVLVDPDPVDIGQTLTMSGYALPNAIISIENSQRESSIVKEISATSNSDGFWSTTVDTGSFSQDTYQVRVKSEQEDGAETGWSNYTYYGVGGEAEAPLFPDLNRDGFVNLVDFSILLFWWATDGGDSDPPADINRDGNVTLTDFSILLFNWTG